MVANGLKALLVLVAALCAGQALARDKYPLPKQTAALSVLRPYAGEHAGLLLRASVGPETSVPYGWVDFCRRYRHECDTQPLAAVDVVMTPTVWTVVERVNRWVNDNVTPESDWDHWGLEDQWDYPIDGKGDCEDYALLKRKMLMDAGVPRQALLMTVVRDENDEGHAILTLRTSKGDYVLDNKVNEIKLWSATGYRYVKRQSQEDPNDWVSLKGNDVPTTATTR
jgi:predicted transglutaminase-like cysteine proteinase